MTDASLLRAVRHNSWANLEMLAFCSRMSPSQLEWTAQGVYGTIHATLQHILAGETGYLRSLTGGELPPGGLLPDTPLAPLERLADLARSNGERIEKVLANETDPDRKITRPSGAIVPATIIVTQFIHHGSDHRAHIGTILGAHSIVGPNLDAWAFGRAIGVSTAAVR
jgi:uncharacterized damage-inducible protein DinB